MSAAGFNPLRWDCESKGCYHKLCRPKLEVFAECFPGKIAMGDVDGIVEINGHILVLEWKSHHGAIPTGQRILLEQITKTSPKITAIVVVGDVVRMSVSSVAVIHSGIIGEAEACDVEGLKARMKAWAERVKR